MTDKRPDTCTNTPGRQITQTDPQQRQAQVLGDGPRIAPLEVSEFSDDLIAIVSRMVEVNVALDSREKETLTDIPLQNREGADAALLSEQLANLPEIIRTMLRHPDLFGCQTDTGIQLLARGALEPRDRELAILRIGWLCQAPYEWGEHVHVAKSIGINSEEIERVTQGSEASGWGDRERSILKATEELYRDSMISDATWNALAGHLGEQQLIELPVLVGQYQTVAYYQNSLRMRLHEGNLGLSER